MLLNEMNQTPLASFKKTSKLLENTFGVKVEFTNDLNKLRSAETKAKAIIENLKYQNYAIDNAEVSKYTLITEALTCLIRHENTQRIDELKMGYANSGTYRRIVDGLAEFVDNSMDIGDSFEEAIADAMKQYRSSKYRYPDYEIESDVQREVHIRNGEDLGSHTELVEPTNLLDDMSQDDILESIEEMKAINEGLLTESDVDHARLLDIAEALLEFDYDAHQELKLQAKDGEEDKKGVDVKFGNRKPMSPKDHAQVQRFKKDFAGNKFESNEVAEAVIQMNSIIEGTLVETEVDMGRLMEIANSIIEGATRGDKYAAADFVKHANAHHAKDQITKEPVKPKGYTKGNKSAKIDIGDTPLPGAGRGF